MNQDGIKIDIGKGEELQMLSKLPLLCVLCRSSGAPVSSLSLPVWRRYVHPGQLEMWRKQRLPGQQRWAQLHSWVCQHHWVDGCVCVWGGGAWSHLARWVGDNRGVVGGGGGGGGGAWSVLNIPGIHQGLANSSKFGEMWLVHEAPIHPGAISNQNPVSLPKPKGKHETEQLHSVRAAPLAKVPIQHFAFAIHPEHFRPRATICFVTSMAY